MVDDDMVDALCEFLADTKLQSFSLLVRSSIKRASVTTRLLLTIACVYAYLCVDSTSMCRYFMQRSL